MITPEQVFSGTRSSWRYTRRGILVPRGRRAITKNVAPVHSAYRRHNYVERVIGPGETSI